MSVELPVAQADIFDLEAGKTEVGESLQCLLFGLWSGPNQWQYSVACSHNLVAKMLPVTKN